MQISHAKKLYEKSCAKNWKKFGARRAKKFNFRKKSKFFVEKLNFRSLRAKIFEENFEENFL